MSMALIGLIAGATRPAMGVRNGLYSIRIEMRESGRGHASGILVLLDGQILGGDTYFYYTGTHSFKDGKWRGELITHQHTVAVGKLLLFGGREVSCGFSGSYGDDEAEIDGTALVGKTSVAYHAVLSLKSLLQNDNPQIGSVEWKTSRFGGL